MSGLKIKLFMIGRKRAKTFRLVVSPSTTRRGGRTVAILGGFSSRNSDVVDFTKIIDVEALKYWMSQGARPTISAGHIVKLVLGTSK